MHKPLLLLPAVVFLALGAAYNPGSPSQEGTAPKTSKAANDSLARGKKIYDIDCALCHDANGDGKTDLAKDMQLSLSDFTDPKTLTGKIRRPAVRPDSQGKGQDAGRGRCPRQERRRQVGHSIHPEHVKEPARRRSSRCPGESACCLRALVDAGNELSPGNPSRSTL